jgi:hypothetical protein
MKLTPILEQVLSEKVEDVKWLQKSYYFAAMDYLPLTPNIAKMLNGEKRMQVFHVTKPANTNKLKALEGTKKTISSMNRIPMNTREELRGVWGNGVMFSLDGTIIINAKGDINSSPDENGRRWIHLTDLGDSRFYREFRDYMQEDTKLAHWIWKLRDDYGKPGTIKDIKLSLTGKELNQFLTLYITRAMEWLKAPNIRGGNNSDEIRRLAQLDNLTAVSDYDEILVNQIRLTGAIVNLDSYRPNPYSNANPPSAEEIKALNAEVESAVGKEHVLYVDSRKSPAKAKTTIDKFILDHGGKIR